mmetsp:Transcript_37131/g.92413  ORF Transcript_37131/g.92413 Transcript_37131/m.92413 type:complete len:252 (+) Transcript_37131:16-771(+)
MSARVLLRGGPWRSARRQGGCSLLPPGSRPERRKFSVQARPPPRGWRRRPSISRRVSALLPPRSRPGIFWRAARLRDWSSFRPGGASRRQRGRSVLPPRSRPGPRSGAARPRGMSNFRQGVPRDKNEAARYYRLAADQDFAAAQCSLAQFYLHGGGGLPKDQVEGVRYHRLAADQNFAPSQLALGSMLIDDDHIPHSRMHTKGQSFSRALRRTRTPTTRPIASRRSSSSAATPTSARSSRCAASAAGRPKG